jgi:hypothetical protein
MIYPRYAEDSLWPILLRAELGLVSLGWYSHTITWPNLTSATGLLLHASCRSTMVLLPHRRGSPIEGEITANSRTISRTVCSPVPIPGLCPVVSFRLPS